LEKNLKSKKNKNQTSKTGLLSFKGISFEEVLSDLLKIKPEPKKEDREKEK
jgi:hypothetical protein